MSHDFEQKKDPKENPFLAAFKSTELGKKKRGSDDDQLNIAAAPIHLGGDSSAKVSDQAAKSAASVMSHWASDKPPIDTLTVADRARKRGKGGLDDGEKPKDDKLGKQDDGGKQQGHE
ncbi:MAG: hypothetical protein JNM40_10395 [Myxococcales bacterium]|nr:hypothetical protein [Myxococcales bacterium]